MIDKVHIPKEHLEHLASKSTEIDDEWNLEHIIHSGIHVSDVVED